MNKYTKIGLLFTNLMMVSQFTLADGREDYEEGIGFETRVAAGMLRNLRVDNEAFVRSHEDTGHFDRFANSQSPRMTFVTCCDSRVHTHAFDARPDNDIFMIRNLSGQFESGVAGIMYGVKHAHTPLLVIMGHDDCGAVLAKTKYAWLVKYGVPKGREDLRKWKEEIEKDPEILKELESIYLSQAAIPPQPGSAAEAEEEYRKIVHANILFNTHRQVDRAHDKFRELIRARKLRIAGALYDFQGREGQDRGRLIWIDARDYVNIDVFTSGTHGAERFLNGEMIPDGQGPTYGPVTGTTYSSPLFRVHKAANEGVQRLKDLELRAPYPGEPKSKL